MDSSTIDLCLEMFDWAKFRRTKGAIKLHLLLDHDGYLPSFAIVTEGNVSDVKMARLFHFDPGTIVVDDRGYNDYALFGRWTTEDVYFVTRMKENALYEVVGEKAVPQNRNILKDELIELRGPKAIEKCPYPLRRIEVYDPETEEVLVFLTNNLKLGATTIAAIYKERWQIEIFFKALKQNLKIKTFVGPVPMPSRSNLDSIDCDADPTIPSTSISISMVPFESCGLVTNEPVYSSRSLDLVEQTLRDTTDSL